MIDWVTGKFWITHNPDVLRSGQSIRTKIIDGIETIEYDVANRLSIKGSHDANITIRSLTDNTVEISGNPAKFLQGHNVFGTNDLKYLVAKMIDKLCMVDELELKPTDIEYENIQSGIYHLSRVDVNEHFFFPSAQLARSWLRAAGNSANMKFRVQACLKKVLYTSLLNHDVSFLKSILSMMKLILRIRVIVYLMNCYRYPNLWNTLKNRYALKLKYFLLN